MIEQQKADFVREFDVSRETLGRLESYHDLLRKWNPSINLVAPSTLEAIWKRHFFDSAQLLALTPRDTETWADLGAGGGFPGLVIAIVAKEQRPDMTVHLVESDQRKCTFLRTVLAATDVESIVHPDRIESLTPLNASVISARALASLPRLMEFGERHISVDGTMILQKGKSYQEDLKSLDGQWNYCLDEHDSRVHNESKILVMKDISRV